jgi:hypothetical protein
MLAMALSYGTVISFLANADQMLSVIGFKDSGKTTSLIVLSAMFAGLISSFFFIGKVKKTLQYKYVLNLCNTFTYLGLLCSFVTFCLLQGVLIKKS